MKSKISFWRLVRSTLYRSSARDDRSRVGLIREHMFVEYLVSRTDANDSEPASRIDPHPRLWRNW